MSTMFPARSTPTVDRASDARERAESLGLTSLGVDVFVAARAHERHQQRVEAARHSAERWFNRQWAALTEGSADADAVEIGRILSTGPAAVHAAPPGAHVAALAMLDASGIGGTGGAGGADGGTARHPAFAGLGKGRKLASDGAAWTSAIEALAHVDGHYDLRLTISRLPGTAPSVTLMGRHTVGGAAVEHILCYIGDGESAPWSAALARRVIRAVAMSDDEPSPTSRSEMLAANDILSSLAVLDAVAPVDDGRW